MNDNYRKGFRDAIIALRKLVREQEPYRLYLTLEQLDYYSGPEGLDLLGERLVPVRIGG